MKRAVVVTLLLLVAVAIAAVLLMQRPRRPRPEGFDAPWSQLPESPEKDWATDVLRSSTVQAAFVQANEGLQHCNMEHYRLEAGDAVKLDLLFEQQPDGMQLMFVRLPTRSDLPALLLPCFEQALEATKPVPTRDVPVGTRWRLGVHLLIHPASELPPEPWWYRFVPQSWRSGGDSAIHIG